MSLIILGIIKLFVNVTHDRKALDASDRIENSIEMDY